MFNENKFIEYMHSEFPNVFSEFYAEEWLENLLQYGLETFEDDYGRFEAFMTSILPEVEDEDLEPFKIINTEI